MLLDEPFDGLEAAQRQAAVGLVRARARAGRAVLLATRRVEDTEELADRVALVTHGTVKCAGAPPFLAAAVREDTHWWRM